MRISQGIETEGLCKWQGLNVDNNAASAVLCNGLILDWITHLEAPK